MFLPTKQKLNHFKTTSHHFNFDFFLFVCLEKTQKNENKQNINDQKSEYSEPTFKILKLVYKLNV